MRIYNERERAALDAKRYRPETVDLRDLPQVSPELAEFAQGTNGATKRTTNETNAAK